MKTFIALITFVQYGELHSNIRHVQAESWDSALKLIDGLLENIIDTMKHDGVTAVQLQSLTITLP